MEKDAIDHLKDVLKNKGQCGGFKHGCGYCPLDPSSGSCGIAYAWERAKKLLGDIETKKRLEIWKNLK